MMEFFFLLMLSFILGMVAKWLLIDDDSVEETS
jgi:hypothetical protein